MIDFKELDIAYKENRFYSLQLEIGDVCYQNCIYCYMNALPQSLNQLSDEKIFEILDDAKKLGITAIEWLGGEPLLRKSVFEFMNYAENLGFKNNMWTGGLPLANKNIAKRTAELCKNGLISIHLSTIDPKIHNILHPNRDERDIKIIIDAVKYLLDIGYPANQILNSVTYTGLQPADDMIKTMEFFYSMGISISLNVYHTYLRPDMDKSMLERFIPDEKDVALVYEHFKNFMDIKHLPMNCVNKQYCSATVAVLNDGYVTPCATIRETISGNVNKESFYYIVNNNRDYLIFEKLKHIENLPYDCQRCTINDICWGCRSRAYAAGFGVYGKDPRCFRTHSDNVS